MLAFVFNLSCLFLMVLFAINQNMFCMYLFLLFFIFGLILELKKYRKLDIEQRYAFSKKFFVFSSIATFLIVAVWFVHIKTTIPIEKQAYSFFQLSLMPYIYSYPTFMIPSLFCALKYANKPLFFKILMGIVMLSAMMLAPLSLMMMK